MKNPGQSVSNFEQGIKLDSIKLNLLPLSSAVKRFTSANAFQRARHFSWYAYQKTSDALLAIQHLGVSPHMEDYEQRKLKVFNLLNFCQLIFGIIIPITAIITRPKITPLGWVAACMPALVSLVVLYLNRRKHHEVSILFYFIGYPVITSIVYLSGMNLGIELFFILYGILAVFFIADIGHLLFTITLSMISYFVLTVVWRDYQFQLEVNGMLYLLNHLIAIVFIFFGLYLLKKENTNYQASILNHNRILREKNAEIELQKAEINDHLELLNKQAMELRELNALKNKLFSVIAHDLKSPMYALRNVFSNIEQFNMPANEVKKMVPEISSDLNYTISLMENLLQWAKCQMHSLEVSLEPVNVGIVADEVTHQLGSQAAAKKISLVNAIDDDVWVTANPDMLKLILRNLVSNAIKFTPAEGYVTTGTEENENGWEIFVSDTGVGISTEHLRMLEQNDYFTTHGTAAEKGTGLGLMLCKEFLTRNGSALLISSEPKNGSRFSFTLKHAEVQTATT